VHLKVSDIDGQRMLVRVENGKGGKDRYVRSPSALGSSFGATMRSIAPNPGSSPPRAAMDPIV
jgi:hypothetical protein